MWGVLDNYEDFFFDYFSLLFLVKEPIGNTTAPPPPPSTKYHNFFNLPFPQSPLTPLLPFSQLTEVQRLEQFLVLPHIYWASLKKSPSLIFFNLLFLRLCKLVYERSLLGWIHLEKGENYDQAKLIKALNFIPGPHSSGS